MKPAIAVLWLLLAIPALGQESSSSEARQASPVVSNVEISNQAPSKPDAPVPKDDLGFTPCPEGDFKPCAMIGGLRYARDNSGLTWHDKTTWAALKNPYVATISVSLIASSVAAIEGTHACVQVRNCEVWNPLFGSRPSRARMYGIDMPLNGLLIYMMAKAKKNGGGVGVMVLGMSLATFHVYEAMDGFNRAH